MSYGIYLYHPSVRAEADTGQELDEFAHPPLDGAAVTQLLAAWINTATCCSHKQVNAKHFSKPVGDSRVDVSVYDTEIAFTVSGGDADALFEALQDASELCDSEHMALFDPQAGEWQDG